MEPGRSSTPYRASAEDERVAYAVKGGIGDFLQCLPFMLSHPEHKYLVASHYDDATLFFKRLGIDVHEISLGRLGGVDVCPRQLFFQDNPFHPRPPQFPTSSIPVVGVHIGGSDYSLSVEKRFGFPPKALPQIVLTHFLSADTPYNFLLFGSPRELGDMDRVNGPRLRLISSDDITVSLSHVAECSILIGSDSAFKTMSAMLRIPTVVWVGDYKDEHRDSRFIDPYVSAGVVSVFRYKDLTREEEVRAGVKFCFDQLEVKCSLCPT